MYLMCDADHRPVGIVRLAFENAVSISNGQAGPMNFGDTNCAGCSDTAGKRHPRQHKEYSGKTCIGLVRAEEFVGKTVRMCDVCHTDPGFLEE